MGKQLDHITPDLQAFIEAQKIYFVATAAETGTVNLSPKGMDSFRILGPNRVMWLNVTGSGNETAAHLLLHDRITVMFCAFEGKPLILRLYGHGKVYHPADAEWTEYAPLFPPLEGARQLVDIRVDLVQTSCGMAVPFMDYNRERTELNAWAHKQGPTGIQNYWARKNVTSIDGFETGIFASNSARQAE
ncbi:pyridoxamine 5'-phosphate oxidase family protein [Dyadobacter fermentans]|uniref:Pyridoxamine 5'-phosphate oxidase-related FMN-binding n=1 Tax=Dyadobacter fermentans (strain ATCC 700827 / DSM 18053 / CIP 107007 / KCTC 52180 / NS114) TaxID=471854 RepID=C6W577_DYAFD|nr:pyridoxamine 5'-phosphate oxidase family protein [Dyadobacter fermentans]ACT92437.1 pyridoxamine 5'-phosphate oxidase-related FMN- binding [Dyadobacter fermentans DSM 18053]